MSVRKCFWVMLLFVMAGAKAQAAEYERLYVFGDSYSDIGEGYLDGNGSTAVGYLARRMGFELLPADAKNTAGKSLDFAISGAQTGSGAGTKIGDAMLAVGMKNQVDDFARRKIRFSPRRTLFYLAGGLNDKNLASSTTVENLEGEIKELYGLGARHIRVAILPTAIPAFSDVAKRLNPEIAKIPDAMRAELPKLDIRLSGWGRYFDEVMNDPAKYGIENTKDACAGRALFHENATACVDPEKHFYYHAGHPSTAVHKVVGDKLYAEMMAK